MAELQVILAAGVPKCQLDEGAGWLRMCDSGSGQDECGSLAESSPYLTAVPC